MADIIQQDKNIEENNGIREYDRMQNFLSKNFEKELRIIKDRFETAQLSQNDSGDMWSNQGIFWDIRDNLETIYNAYLLEVDMNNCESKNDKKLLEEFRKYLKSFYLDSKSLVGNIARDHSLRHMDKIKKFLKRYEKYLNTGDFSSNLLENSLYNPTISEQEQEKIGGGIIKKLMAWTKK